MASLNRHTIIGHLGKDPTKRDANGKPVTSFSVATSERWTDKGSGEQREKTCWHNVVVWGAHAEACAQYLHKGSKVYVEGRSETRKYPGEDGTDRYITEITATSVIFLDRKEDRRDAPQQESRAQSYGSEEIPFAWLLAVVPALYAMHGLLA